MHKNAGLLMCLLARTSSIKPAFLFLSFPGFREEPFLSGRDHPYRQDFHAPTKLLSESLLSSRIIHCDETRVQVLKEPGREPCSQCWMWVQTSGLPDRPVILFD
ncbi:hypothetical protein METHP15_1120001 [Pseudomonas sp. P15-2025]